MLPNTRIRLELSCSHPETSSDYSVILNMKYFEIWNVNLNIIVLHITYRTIVICKFLNIKLKSPENKGVPLIETAQEKRPYSLKLVN